MLAHLGQRLDGRRRVERHAGGRPGLADLHEHAVQVHARLLMDRDDIGAGGRERVHVPLGALDHEVNVDQRAGAVNERLAGPRR